jgi:hypothetical protein
MEVTIRGEGEIVIRFIDARGQTLLEERVAVSGSRTVEARRIVPVALETTDGAVSLAPVLVRRSNPRQRVTFDGQAPSAWTRKRCREIKCPPGIVADAARGLAPEVAPGEFGGRLSEGPDLRRLVARKDDQPRR